MEKNYLVYWAHLEEHTDPKTQGYIGITKNLKKRIKEHKIEANSGNNSTFKKAIRKYGSKIIWKVLNEKIDSYEAKVIEYCFRPSAKIGWNIDIGGNLGGGTEWTEERREKQRIISKKIWSDEKRREKQRIISKEIWSNEERLKKHSLKYKGEKNPNFGNTGKKNPRFGVKWSEEKIEYFKSIWTEEKRKNKSENMKGEKNANFGKRGELHPLYGVKRTEEAKANMRKPKHKDFGKNMSGTKNPNSKLTEDNINYIMNLTLNKKELAKIFNVNYRTIEKYLKMKNPQ